MIDTHLLLWTAKGATELIAAPVRELLEDPAQDFYVSAVSGFEMATKFRIGKLPEAKPLLNDFSRLVQNLGFHLLDLTTRHAVHGGVFPAAHRDPFDRLLAAQAHLEGMVLLSKDPLLDRFGIPRLWSEPRRLP